MDTVESTFGIGCDLKKVAQAMMEQDENVIVDEEGQTISDLEKILDFDEPCIVEAI